MRPLLLVALLAACQSPPTLGAAPPFDGSMPVDAGPVDPLCHAACVNLAKLGCQEGAPACEGSCTKTRNAGLTELHPECLAAATSKDQVRACLSVSCP